MTENVSGPLALLVLIFLNLVLLGLIHARLDRLQSPIAAQLGPVLGLAGYRESVAHSARWTRLILWAHWRMHDPLLSLLCLASTVLVALTVSYPFWRASLEALCAGLVAGPA